MLRSGGGAGVVGGARFSGKVCVWGGDALWGKVVGGGGGACNLPSSKRRYRRSDRQTDRQTN